MAEDPFDAIADAQIQSIAQRIFQASRPEDLLGVSVGAKPYRSWTESGLELGENFLMGALDLLDRPGRALRQTFLNEDWRQGLEALDPMNLITPETESRPYFSADWLEKHGVPEGFHVPVIGSARSIGGFFLDVLTDPLTLAGGWIGRGAAKGLGATGRAGLKVADAAAARPGLLGSAAGAALDLGGKFSETIKYRQFPEFLEGLKATRDRIRGLQIAVGKEAQMLGKRFAALEKEAQAPILSALEHPFIRPVLAENLPELADEGLPDALGIAKTLLKAEGKSGKKSAAAAFADEQAGVLRKSLDNLTPVQRQIIEDFWTGDPRVRELIGIKGLFGKMARESGMLSRDILTEQGIRDFLKRNKLQHLTHVRDPVRLAEELTGELAGAMGVSKVLTPAERASLIAKAKSGTVERTRNLALSLEQLEQKYPGQFVGDLGTIMRAEGYHYANVTTSTDFLRATFKDRRYAQPAAVTVNQFGKVRAHAKPGFTILDVENLPEWLKKDASTTIGNHADELLAAGMDIEDIERYAKSGRRFGLQVPNEIAGDIEGMVKRINVDPDGGKFHAFMEGVRRLYQGVTLSLFPSSWVNNFMGNVWSNHVSAGKGQNFATLLADHTDAARVLMGPKATGGMIRGVGKHDEVVADLLERGVWDGGFAGTEMGEKMNRLAFEPKTTRVLRAMFDPAVNPVMRGGYWMMQAGDNLTRVAHYIGRIRAGMSPDEAARSVKKWLYNGRGLTQAEEGLRNYMPFYGWARFNIPRSLLTLAERPGKVAQFGRLKIKADEDWRVDVPDEILPEFMQSQFNMPFGRDAEGKLRVFMGQNWIPLAQLQQVSSPKKAIEFLFSQFAPFIREPFQQTINYDTFFKDVIEKYPGQTEQVLGMNLGKRDSHLVRVLRVFNEADRILGGGRDGQRVMDQLIEDLTAEERAMRFFVGRSYTVNLQVAKQRTMGRYAREIREAKGRRRFARQKDDWANVKALETLIRSLTVKRNALAGFDPARHPSFEAEDAD